MSYIGVAPISAIKGLKYLGIHDVPEKAEDFCKTSEYSYYSNIVNKSPKHQQEVIEQLRPMPRFNAPGNGDGS